METLKLCDMIGNTRSGKTWGASGDIIHSLLKEHLLKLTPPIAIELTGSLAENKIK
ncbi:hypothetical protein [Paenibacillus periandrae]|uniref:hypothetical protein n=1 Tax=Paenibacillus periandrae TaxID=1761741 RepID=UPI001F089706|nr:hypothetical protein [Paenibacillus periandrae]